MSRVRVVWSLALVRTDRVGQAAAVALSNPDVAESPEVAAFVARCAEDQWWFLHEGRTLAWGCCEEAYVADADTAEAALEAFERVLREYEQVEPGEDGTLVRDPWPER